ncbi:hypothetical protein KKE78_00265 [Patescibacteria group bacterium]|nr:hypothetical protein [Patescibacteria group bacterium]
MDNPNNKNSPTNPNPTSPFGGPTQAPSSLGNLPTSISTPIQSGPTPIQPKPTIEPSSTSTPFPSSTPALSSTPNWPPSSKPTTIPAEAKPTSTLPPIWPQDTTKTNLGSSSPTMPENAGSNLDSAWAPSSSTQSQLQSQSETPTQPKPTVSNPWSKPQPSPSIDPIPFQQTTTWMPPTPSGLSPISKPQQPETPDQPEPDLPLAEPTPAKIEPIPAQPEPIPAHQGITPASVPPATDPANDTDKTTPATSPLNNPWETTPANPSQPSWMMNAETNNTPPSPTETIPIEVAPTDLSHLITSSPQQDSVQSAPETQIASPTSPTANQEASTLSTKSNRGIPKWLFGVGTGLLILVICASAYFILGIGQPSGTTSLPATTTPQTTQVKPPLPIATNSAQSASGSANFGEFQGNTATRAADLMKQE